MKPGAVENSTFFSSFLSLLNSLTAKPITSINSTFFCLLSSYEPELHPGVTFKMRQPKATLKIFSTGSITVTAPRVQNVQEAIEKIFYMVYEFQKPKGKHEEEKMAAKEKKSQLAQQ